jgi:hypothetical protein
MRTSACALVVGENGAVQQGEARLLVELEQVAVRRDPVRDVGLAAGIDPDPAIQGAECRRIRRLALHGSGAVLVFQNYSFVAWCPNE